MYNAELFVWGPKRTSFLTVERLEVPAVVLLHPAERTVEETEQLSLWIKENTERFVQTLYETFARLEFPDMPRDSHCISTL